jgi:hypothetical protein
MPHALLPFGWDGGSPSQWIKFLETCACGYFPAVQRPRIEASQNEASASVWHLKPAEQLKAMHIFGSLIQLSFSAYIDSNYAQLSVAPPYRFLHIVLHSMALAKYASPKL